MSDETDLIKLYSARILALAAEIPHLGRMEDAQASGNVQKLVEMRLDCDRDCLLVLVEQSGPACHTGRRNCFYTAIQGGEEVELMKPMV